ncbi:helix-turn-helix transcriptional regulator [Anaerotignum lactatifermentans]|uniref:Helix-turn-helix transcriptional regulator n=1 Tax=Anaerotignum lactatifermentans TaxID=160404 RepID=A0ABS2GDF1_9FIRM|nr:helix-turn-helix transcriptional regulator [Anaerotignum lactatifermentans]MBM6830352.1 helix-turn-helix transcriptional regulator [Anaerotignum lactatifermentans]MBM6878897.1 helix-turn-helix transcriptional regulator [Anaerotignum lactatifermentans]MBM6951913.1 helix-turn-helix transcriptional regulator [Anaerotignum lactatifermentans]
MLVNIEVERVRNQMTKEELAKEIGITLKTYYNWINGVTAIPSTKLQKMAKFFGVKMEYLLEESEVEKNAI